MKGEVVRPIRTVWEVMIVLLVGILSLGPIIPAMAAGVSCSTTPNSCSTSGGGGGGGGGFDAITTGTNTTATMTCGTGCTITKSGSGSIVASTAAALAANPTDCASNQFANAIAASGNLTCAALTVAGAQFANQGTTTTVLHGNAAGNPSWGAVSLTADVTGALPAANGGTGSGFGTDDAVLVGNGITWDQKVIGDCDDTGGNHLNYDTTTNAFSCGTSSSGGGSLPVSDSTSIVEDNGDATKEVRIEASGITTGTVRVWTAQDSNGTVAFLAGNKAGSGTATFRPSGVIAESHSNLTTSGTTEESLWSYTVPGGTLSADGDMLRIITTWTGASNTNSKTIIHKFGSTELMNQSFTTSGVNIMVTQTLRRTGAATQGGTFFLARGTNTQTGRATPGETLSGNVTLDIRATTGSAAGDVTLNGVTVEYLPAP